MKLADGRVHPASEAAKLGLIDGVATLDSVFAQLLNGPTFGTLPAGATKMKGPKMDEAGIFLTDVDRRVAKGVNHSDALLAAAKANPRGHLLWLANLNEQQGRRVAARSLREQAQSR